MPAAAQNGPGQASLPAGGIEDLRDERRFRKLLAFEIAKLREQVRAIRSQWEAYAAQPEIPRLPPPFGGSRPAPGPDPLSSGFSLEGVEVLSLDIFDTCLRRISGPPETVFQMLEREMALAGAPLPGFSGHRVRMENQLRRAIQERGQREDVCLEEIYDGLGESLAWTEDTRVRWMDRECALEAALVRPLGEVRERAREAVARGIPLVYVSEMYLSSRFLKRILRAAGFPVEDAAVHVSGEAGLSKGSGRLYQQVRAAFPGKRILHIGDNPETDVRVPREAGMSVFHYKPAAPAYADPGSQILHSLASEADPGWPFWQRLGFRVVGPLAVAWTLRLAEESRRRGLRTLCFLTRDGYFPKQVYDALQPLMGFTAVSRTAFASRRLLGLAAMEQVTAEDWDFLLKPAPAFRVRDFFERVDLPRDRYEPACRKAGLDPHAVICHHRGFHDPRSKDRLYAAFVEVMDAFYAVRDGLRERVQAYWETLGWRSGLLGIVDIGWNASSFDSLRRILGDPAVDCGFYLGVWRARQAELPVPERLQSFLIDGPDAEREEQLIRGGVGVLEFLMGSPGESVRDLRLGPAGWEPVTLRPGILGPYENTAYAEMESGFQEFLSRFVAACGYLAPGDGKAFLRDQLEGLLYQPTPEERAHLGAVSHAEGWGSSRRMRLLPRFDRLTTPESRYEAYCYSAWKAAWRNPENA